MTLSSIQPGHFIDKPGHGKIGYTNCHVLALGIRYDSIYLHELFTGSIKSGLGKLLNTTMRPQAWLFVESWNMEVPDRFSTIKKLGMELR